jgi:hypothetical protein
VLEQLTGVGTDMSVNRPIVISGSGPKESFRPGRRGGGSGAPPVVEAIKADPRLTPCQGQSMLEIYEALTREERRFTSEKP